MSGDAHVRFCEKLRVKFPWLTRLPLYRQEAMWKRMEIDMPRSSLCGWILKTAELCEPLIRLLQKNIVAYDYAQVDETTVQVLNEIGRDNQTKSYMWVYRGGGEKTKHRL